MKNVLINKYLFILIFVITINSCKKEAKSPVNNENKFKNFYSKVDSLEIDNINIVIKKLYKKNSINYILNLYDKNYIIPYSYISGKDTLQANSFSIEDVNKSSIFKIKFGQGNASFYNYNFYINNEKEIILHNIVFSYLHTTIGNKQNIDSLSIDKNLRLLNKADITSINNFLNKN